MRNLWTCITLLTQSGLGYKLISGRQQGENRMTKVNRNVLHEARTAHKLKVCAKVTDAEFDLMIERLTEVLAEPTEDPNHYSITWPYGVSCASATVHRNSLIFT